MMINPQDVIAMMIAQRATIPSPRAMLVAISGIDGSGKGYVAKEIAAMLGQHQLRVANINIDGWLNLPHRRFSATNPAEHFYNHAIRFDELFAHYLPN
jgi:uridine kinase